LDNDPSHQDPKERKRRSRIWGGAGSKESSLEMLRFPGASKTKEERWKGERGNWRDRSGA
jgi:hypothetical protein